MRARKKFLPFLFLGLLSFSGLLFYVFFISPKQNMDTGLIPLSPILLFFVLLLATLSFLSTFLLKNLRRGILVGIFFTAILLLRLIGFTNIIYIGILLVIVLLLELGFRKR